MSRFSFFWGKKGEGGNWIFQCYLWWTFRSSETNFIWAILHSSVQNWRRTQIWEEMWTERAVVYFTSYCIRVISRQMWTDTWHFTFSFGFFVHVWSSWELGIILNKYVKISQILGMYIWICFAGHMDNSPSNLLSLRKEH